MQFLLYKSLWGAVGSNTPHRSFTEVIPAVSSEGWDGVVFALIAHQFDDGLGSTARLADLCTGADLGLSIMVHTSGDTAAEHLGDLRAQLESVAPFSPHHVVCHGGNDSFDAPEATRFLRESVQMAADLGIRVGHETHRGRILFNPWVTARMLEAVDGLDLVVDLSHWVVVAERLLPDEAEIIERCGSAAIHVDARVGHEQSPQVPDPTAPEWSHHVATFEAWWERLCDRAAAAGRDELVFVPEYGPPPYQQTMPRTGEPTTDLWEVVRVAGESLRSRFGRE